MSVSGGSELRAALAEVEGTVRDALSSAVEDEAEAVADDERAGVPVASGDLQAGIEVRGLDDLSAEIGIYDDALLYGVWIEWGRSSAPAQPFATPAAEQSRQRWPPRAAQAVKDAVDG